MFANSFHPSPSMRFSASTLAVVSLTLLSLRAMIIGSRREGRGEEDEREEMAWRVSPMTLPMIAAMSFMDSRIEAAGSLERMEETRDWIDWRRNSFWSRRKVFLSPRALVLSSISHQRKGDGGRYLQVIKLIVHPHTQSYACI